jgi:hypothetical protein
MTWFLGIVGFVGGLTASLMLAGFMTGVATLTGWDGELP